MQVGPEDLIFQYKYVIVEDELEWWERGINRIADVRLIEEIKNKLT